MTQDKKSNLHKMHRERMRNEILASQSGIFSLPPHRLLEYILFYGIPYKDTNPLAHELLEYYGSLEAVFSASVGELKRFKNMTEIAAMLINTIGMIPSYIERDKVKEVKTVKTPLAAEKFLRPLFMNAPVELFYLVSLDLNYKVLGSDLIKSGGPFFVDIDIARTVDCARRRGAVNVLIAHNHPSGNIKPSADDLDVTTKLTVALALSGINLVDHYVLTQQNIFSFAMDYKHGNIIADILQQNVSLFSQRFICENTYLRQLMENAEPDPKGFLMEKQNQK